MIGRANYRLGAMLKCNLVLHNQVRAFCSVSTPDSYYLYYWIAGFIEGEGSFNVSFKLKADLRMGIQVSPELSVTQHVAKHMEKLFSI